MKKSVQILLLVACFVPLLGVAREETPEERKQRIMRKYLRIRSSVVLSDLQVPEESAEEPDVADSERYQEPQVDFERQQPGATLPPPAAPRRPPPRKTEDRNWLLAEEADPADPYGDLDGAQQGAELEAWTSWDFRDDAGSSRRKPLPSSESTQVDLRNSRRRPSLLDMRTPEVSTPQGQTFRSVYPEEKTGGGLFGRQPESRSVYGESNPFQKTPSTTQPDIPTFDTPRSRSSSQLGGSENRKFGSDHRTFGSDAKKEQSSGFTTYRNPYENQQNSTRLSVPQEQQQEYKRSNPYQKWKNNRQEWDPTKDDAYLNELMNKR